ncbi:MAG: LysM peptidoglycan-binding domain-containing protein [Flavobacteriaceae bacterium]
MFLFTKGFLFSLIVFQSAFLFGQSQVTDEANLDYLTMGYDIRTIDLLNIDEPSIVTKQFRPIYKIRSKNTHRLDKQNQEIYYVSSAFDFEKQILKTDTTTNLFLSRNSSAFNPQILESSSKPIQVYSIQKNELYNESITTDAIELDSLFVEAVSKIFEDKSIPGLVHHFGTHFPLQITYGGYYINRLSIDKDEFLFSPYDEKKFKDKVSQLVKAVEEGLDFSDPFLNIKSQQAFIKGGKENVSTTEQWQKTIQSNPKPIAIEFQRLSKLLTKENFPNDTLIDRKRRALDLYINFIESKLKSEVQEPVSSDFFKKYAIPFKQRLVSILKTNSGKETDNTSSYKGDLFFGGFADSQTVIASTYALDRREIELQTLITDEKIEVNKLLEYIVPYENFEDGFANVWDESKKLIKGVGRTDLVISGEEENRIYFKEALRNKVKKKIQLSTIDSDEFEIVYSLESVNVSNEIQNLKSRHTYVMPSELIAAASIGDIEFLENKHHKKTNINVDGLIRAAVLTSQPVVFFNRLFDLGIRPNTNDLDLLFDTTNYNEEVAIAFLERGAIPKNNMIFKAVAYRSPNVIKALIREGAQPANNDLEFAIKLDDLALVSALTGKEVVEIKNNQLVYRENNQIIEPVNTIVTYVVKKGDYLGKIARQYNTSVTDLIKWNNLKTNTIFVNQKLKIFLNNDATTSVVSENESIEEELFIEPETPKTEKIYQVKSGDYLGKIANDHQLSIAELKKLNNLTSTTIKVNQKLIVGYENKSVNETIESTSVSENTTKEPKINSLINEEQDEVAQSNINEDEAVEIEDFVTSQGQTEQDAMDAVLQDNENLAVKIIQKLQIKNEVLLRSAVREGQLQVVETLLKNNTKPESGLEIAIFYRQIEILKMLVENGAEIDPNHLILTIKTDYLEGFNYLIDKGVIPTAQVNTETPIHHLVMTYTENRFKMLQYLKTQSVNLNVKNDKNETLLHKAVIVGEENIPVIQFLLENKIDLNAKDQFGKQAIELTNNKKIKSLISNYN